MIAPNDVLFFWFGRIYEDGSCAPDSIKRWWSKNPDFDREVSETFGTAIAAAEAGELESWKDSAESCLALIILCDQMTRNSRRDTGAMYHADEQARAALEHALERGYEQELRTIQSYFLLMPLMHAESRELQKEGVRCFDALVESAEPGAKKSATEAAEYMRKHELIVARFGRFPHRNTLLGRESSEEELEFLKQPGSSF